ncbi:hypothetical protein B7463_g7893, partial [Scytalidium lignicola]
MIRFRSSRHSNAHRNARMLLAKGHSSPIKLHPSLDPEKHTYFLEAGSETWLFLGKHLTTHLPLLPNVLKRAMALYYDVVDHFYGQWIHNFDPYIYEGALRCLLLKMYRLEEAAGHLNLRYWQQWHLYNARNHNETVFEEILLWRLPQWQSLGSIQELEDDLYNALQYFMAIYEILRPDRGFGVGRVLYGEIILEASQFAEWIAEYLGGDQLFVMVYWVVKIAYNYDVQEGFEAARQMVRQLDRKERQELENEAGQRKGTDQIAEDLFNIIVLRLY